MTTLPARPMPLRRRVRKAVSRFGRRRTEALERWFARRSLVETTELLSPASFPWAKKLEANWTIIRRELEGVLTQRADLPQMQYISDTQSGLTREGDWKVFFFTAYGLKSERNRQRCPETARLLDSIRGLEVAFFSVLEPGAHLDAHRGIYKGLVRAHLGLIVPEPRERARMQIGRETIVWEEGRCVIFDDTYRHEVWNETDGLRVVLLIDVRRPLPPLLDLVNQGILRLARWSPFVTEATRKHKDWERAFYEERAQ